MVQGNHKAFSKDALRSHQEFLETEALRDLWNVSEGVLEFLRSIGSPPVEPDAGMLRRWQPRLSKVDAGLPWAPQPDPHTPNGYFECMFPKVVAKYGRPFLQLVTERGNLPRTELRCLNDDVFAAILGGDPRLGHRVVFHLPDQTFYFYDCAREMFVPTTEAKLRLLTSNYLLKCAQSMSTLVNVEPLFTEYRSDKVLSCIVGKARAMHAASADFFAEGGNVRIDAPSAAVVPRIFVQEALAKEKQSTLTVTEAFQGHLDFCEQRGLTPLQRRDFKALIAEVVRQIYGLGVRHDLVGLNGRSQQGWVGLSCRAGELALSS